MTETLLITQLILAVVITIIVLLQKSSSIGLGAYSGSNDSVFGSKGPASFLSKVTFTMIFLFLVNTIALGYFYNKEANASILDSAPKGLVPTIDAEEKTAPTAIPDIESSSNVTTETIPVIPDNK